MQPKSLRWLEDIRSSADLILQATAQRSPADYEADALLRAAVERHFEIIGEVVGRLSRHDPDTAQRIDNYPRIIAFRNILIHGYDLVDHAQVWQVLRHDLPRLNAQVAALLGEAD